MMCTSHVFCNPVSLGLSGKRVSERQPQTEEETHTHKPSTYTPSDVPALRAV